MLFLVALKPLEPACLYPLNHPFRCIADFHSAGISAERMSTHYMVVIHSTNTPGSHGP